MLTLNTYANDTQPELIKMRATSYCLSGTTCTGIDVREGICASGRVDLIGKTIILYHRLPNDELGQIIGIYEVQDSGCSDHVIDVWKPDLEMCQEFMNEVYEDGCKGKVFVQVIGDSNG